jgi:hypothetical protein
LCWAWRPVFICSLLEIRTSCVGLVIVAGCCCCGTRRAGLRGLAGVADCCCCGSWRASLLGLLVAGYCCSGTGRAWLCLWFFIVALQISIVLLSSWALLPLSFRMEKLGICSIVWRCNCRLVTFLYILASVDQFDCDAILDAVLNLLLATRLCSSSCGSSWRMLV